MKKILVVLFVMLLVTGCGASNSENELDNVKEEKYTLTNDQSDKVEFIKNAVELDGDSFDFNELSDRNKMLLIFHIASAISYKYDDSREAYLTKENLENVTKEYFGNNAKLKVTDVPCRWCTTPYYLYDEATGTFIDNPNHLGHGGSLSDIKHKHVSTVKKGNIVSVKYKVLFSNYVDIGAPVEFYKSLDDAKKGENPVASFNNYCTGDDIIFECNYDKMFEEIEFNTYSYNFKLDGDNFYFVGYTIE